MCVIQVLAACPTTTNYLFCTKNTTEHNFKIKIVELTIIVRISDWLITQVWSLIVVWRKWFDENSTTMQSNQKNHIHWTLTLFWLAESLRWIFEISACDVITADYMIIMSRTLKATGNRVMCDRRAWFLRVIMSTLHDSCCLLSVKKKKYDFQVFAFTEW